ncbi:MAG: hypothetical protein ABJC89_20735 [Acidobacteriota bacterium]
MTEPLNGPPSVTVAFPVGTHCTPSLNAPRTLEVVAQGVDPEGDNLHYSWSGCATGAGQHAVCTVAAPGPVAATVTVDDGFAHIVRASASATGINRLPDVSIGYVVIPSGASGEIDVLGNVVDSEDGFLCGAEYCGGITYSGACGAASLSCSCLAGLEVRIVRTLAVGTSSINLEVKDRWGAVAQPTIAIDVATLKILSHSGPAAVSTRVPESSKR